MRLNLRISPRTFLKVLLVSLVAMVFILVYIYYLLARPPGPPPLETKEIKHLFSIYGYGAEPGERLSRPHDVAFDKQGNIYIADTGNTRILVFDGRGRFLFRFGKKGTGPGGLFQAPIGVTVDRDGRIYVSDRNLSKVAIFNARGEFIKEFRVMWPLKPLVVGKKLYLTTYAHVMIYDLNGKKLAEWGRSRSRAEGQFDFPDGIAVGGNGNVYISDTNNLRLQAFTSKGDLLWVEGKPAEDIMASERRFGLPVGLALDENSLLYLVDAFHHQIRVLTTKAEELVTLSDRGDREGELYFPARIAYGGNGIFAIADKYNDRVQVVRITVKIKK